jgi:dihydropteroate synthase
MGIVNVTPDSFSDGGQFYQAESAIDHGLSLIKDGAEILDIGGESTRPGAESISKDEELNRILPVIKGLRKFLLIQQNQLWRQKLLKQELIL